MVKSASVLPLLFTMTLPLSACNFQESKLDEDQSFGGFTEADLNYPTIHRRIIEPYCLSCHALATGDRAGINLESYAELSSRIPLLYQTTITEKSMPPLPDPPLPDEAVRMLEAWFSRGAPE